MSPLNLLRQLVDQQQHEVLKLQVVSYLDDSHDIQAFPLKALAHAYLGERAEAERALVTALQSIAELDEDAQVDLAGVYCVIYQIDKAVALLEPIISSHAEHSLALARLAWCRLQAGELDDALTLYQKSIALNPNRLPVWSALIRLFIETKQGQSAQDALDNGIACLKEIHTQLPETAVEQFTEQHVG